MRAGCVEMGKRAGWERAYLARKSQEERRGRLGEGAGWERESVCVYLAVHVTEGDVGGLAGVAAVLERVAVAQKPAEDAMLPRMNAE